VRAAKLLGTVLHLHRGTPYIYQGEELGMTNLPWAGIEDFRDLDTLNYWAEAQARGDDPQQVLAALRAQSRDNGRTPMQWDASANAGFTGGTPWIGVNPNYVEVNAADQVDDPDSVFHHYRRLIELRHEMPVVAHGSFAMLLPDDERIYAFTRARADVELLVLANFGAEPRQVRLPRSADWGSADLLLTNYPDEPERWQLRAWEAKVLQRGPAAARS
jgi:oligo-1,6-glucosidase